MNRREIVGKYNTAIAYASIIEEAAVEQIRLMCDQKFTAGSKIRIMPDVHWGRGCTIGTTMTITDKVVPNLVGVDIGCGLYTVKLEKGDIDLPKFDEAAHFVPSGRNIWDGRHEKFDLTELRCYRELNDAKRIGRSLGTLGGGNHFCALEKASDGTVYLNIHTGSRNLGKQVAEIYQKLAVKLSQGWDELYAKQEEMIREYKAAGRRSELNEAIKELHRNFRQRRSDIPDDLAPLFGKYLDDYLHDMEICQQFALRNREVIAEVLLERTGLAAEDAFHTVHNYIDIDERILRKGAIAAHKGERVLIPINMRDGSLLAVGKGEADWNFSAPHGAGRVLSRSAAKEKLSMEEYQASMEGIYSTSVNENTLDEAPMAYKCMEDIIDDIGEAVDIVEVLKPIYNFKAG